MANPIRYVVLTETSERHHVAIARNRPANGWIQIVATFARRDRADSYCAVENDLIGEMDRKEEEEAPPVHDVVHSGLNHVMEMIEQRSSVETRTRSYVTPAGNERPLGGLREEIMAELPTLIEEFPKGPTAKIFAERLCVEETFVRRAIHEIAREHQATFMRRKDSPSYHLVPINYDPPPEDLTPTQKAVFDAMATLAAADGTISISKRAIADKARIATGNTQAVLDALRLKGRLEEVTRGRGDNNQPNTYRMLGIREAA